MNFTRPRNNGAEGPIYTINPCEFFTIISIKDAPFQPTFGTLI